MNPEPVEQARTRELAWALPALRRARQRAEEMAIAKNMCTVQVQDGRIVQITADELKRDRAQKGGRAGGACLVAETPATEHVAQAVNALDVRGTLARGIED